MLLIPQVQVTQAEHDAEAAARAAADTTHTNAISALDTDLDGLFAAWRPIYVNQSHRLAASIVTGANTYLWGTGTPVVSTDNVAGLSGWSFDPADFAIAGKTTKMRLRVHAGVDDVAPANTLTVGLYEITGLTGGGSAAVPTLSAVIANSTVAITTPAANSNTHSVSSEFTPPTAGKYVIGAAASGAAAANSAVVIAVTVQIQYE